MAYDAVLFDNDGVLIEPPAYDVLYEAAQTAFETLSVSDPAAEHVEDVVIGVTPDVLDRVCAAYDLDVETFWVARDETASLAQQREIRTSDRDLYDDVETIDALEADLGIVSTNQHATIEYILEHFDLHGRFATYYGRDPTVASLTQKKPNPHYVDRALTDLGTRDALFVGDSESDLQAAANAGIDSAFVRRPHRLDYELAVEPTYEIDGLDDLRGLVN